MKLKPLSFNIEGVAPTSEQLAARAKTLDVQIVSNKRLTYAPVATLIIVGAFLAYARVSATVAGAIAGAVAGAIAGAVGIAGAVAIAGAIAGATAFMGAFTFSGAGAGAGAVAVVVYLQFHKETLLAELAELDIIEQSSCLKVIGWCEAHKPIAAYQNQVAKQGRFLVAGEAKAMQEWVASVASVDARTSQAEIHAKEQQACERLKSPVIAAT